MAFLMLEWVCFCPENSRRIGWRGGRGDLACLGHLVCLVYLVDEGLSGELIGLTDEYLLIDLAGRYLNGAVG